MEADIERTQPEFTPPAGVGQTESIYIEDVYDTLFNLPAELQQPLLEDLLYNDPGRLVQLCDRQEKFRPFCESSVPADVVMQIQEWPVTWPAVARWLPESRIRQGELTYGEFARVLNTVRLKLALIGFIVGCASTSDRIGISVEALLESSTNELLYIIQGSTKFADSADPAISISLPSEKSPRYRALDLCAKNNDLSDADLAVRVDRNRTPSPRSIDPRQLVVVPYDSLTGASDSGIKDLTLADFGAFASIVPPTFARLLVVPPSVMDYFPVYALSGDMLGVAVPLPQTPFHVPRNQLRSFLYDQYELYFRLYDVEDDRGESLIQLQRTDFDAYRGAVDRAIATKQIPTPWQRLAYFFTGTATTYEQTVDLWYDLSSSPVRYNRIAYTAWLCRLNENAQGLPILRDLFYGTSEFARAAPGYVRTGGTILPIRPLPGTFSTPTATVREGTGVGSLRFIFASDANRYFDNVIMERVKKIMRRDQNELQEGEELQVVGSLPVPSDRLGAIFDYLRRSNGYVLRDDELCDYIRDAWDRLVYDNAPAFLKRSVGATHPWVPFSFVFRDIVYGAVDTTHGVYFFLFSAPFPPDLKGTDTNRVHTAIQNVYASYGRLLDQLPAKAIGSTKRKRDTEETIERPPKVQRSTVPVPRYEEEEEEEEEDGEGENEFPSSTRAFVGGRGLEEEEERGPPPLIAYRGDERPVVPTPAYLLPEEEEELATETENIAPTTFYYPRNPFTYM